MIDFITCKICNQNFKNITQHLLFKHNMTPQQYRNTFGISSPISIRSKELPVVDPKCSQTVKSGYIKINSDLQKLQIIYSKQQVIEMLMYDNYYLKFSGKAKNRTLLKEDQCLYKCLYYYSDILLDHFNTVKLPNRIEFAIKHHFDIGKLKCKCNSTYSYSGYCRMCKPTYPSKQWFYHSNAHEKYSTYQSFYQQNSIGKIGPKLSLPYFIDKYGTCGYEKYISHYVNIFKVKGVKYSKISQQLFKKIITTCKIDLKQVYFAQHNKEYVVPLTIQQREVANQSIYILDFKYKEYNIQFDGQSQYYLKDSQYINTRDSILKSRGYKILRIKQNRYKKERYNCLIECRNFLCL